MIETEYEIPINTNERTVLDVLFQQYFRFLKIQKIYKIILVIHSRLICSQNLRTTVEKPELLDEWSVIIG